MVRLVGEGSEESHALGEAWNDPGSALQDIRDAASWITERLVQGEGARAGLRMICVDVDGARCSWLSAPGVEDSVVAAALAVNDHWGEGGTPTSVSNGPWAAPNPEESTIQALATPASTPAATNRPLFRRSGGKKGTEDASAGERLAVLTVPDVGGRLLVDALDDLNISVDRVVSLWHAMAMAWDPAGPASPRSPASDGVVDAGAPVSGVLLVDRAGRLIWSWSRGADLLAAGSMRLHREGDAAISIDRAMLSRLATEWLGWSAQLGVAPARVIIVTPDLGAPGEGAESELSPADVGQALGELWPGAVVDLAVNDDPVLATLTRVARMDAPSAQGASDARQSLVGISRRPGRAHRSMHRWIACAVLAGAIAMGVVAWRTWSSAAAAGQRAKSVRAEVGDLVMPLVPASDAVGRELARSQPVDTLTKLVEHKRQDANPTKDLDVAMPILSELSAISAVLGTDMIEIKEIQLTPLNVSIDLTVTDTATAEMIGSAIDRVEGSHCTWTTTMGATARPAGTAPGEGSRTSLTLLGTWKRNAGGAR
jgi:hypothetical protein